MAGRKWKPRDVGALVVVEWVDSANYRGTGWNHKDDVAASNPIRLMTVGWLLRNDSVCVTVAASVKADHPDNEQASDSVQGDMTIPRGCVVRIKRIGL